MPHPFFKSFVNSRAFIYVCIAVGPCLQHGISVNFYGCYNFRIPFYAYYCIVLGIRGVQTVVQCLTCEGIIPCASEAVKAVAVDGGIMYKSPGR